MNDPSTHLHQIKTVYTGRLWWKKLYLVCLTCDMRGPTRYAWLDQKPCAEVDGNE